MIVKPRQNVFDIAVISTGKPENFIDILLANGKPAIDLIINEELIIPDLPKKRKVIDFFAIASSPTSLDYSPPVSTVCEPGEVMNSDGSFVLEVLAGMIVELDDVTHTDTDGSDVLLPGMTPMVCTPVTPFTPSDVENTDGDNFGQTANGQVFIVPNTVIENSEGEQIELSSGITHAAPDSIVKINLNGAFVQSLNYSFQI